MVNLKQKFLGLHRMYKNNGIEDNIEVHEILVKGLGWEVCVARCLHTIQCMQEPYVGEQENRSTSSSSTSCTGINLSIARPTSCGYRNEISHTWSLKLDPLVEFSFQSFKCETSLCLKEHQFRALKRIPFIGFDYLTIVVH